ncbi:MAG: serine endoprotease DegQ [Kangiellaceae bacterium]|nr:serine endoprotease DegQ [Kangiellaceae bacterium]
MINIYKGVAVKKLYSSLLCSAILCIGVSTASIATLPSAVDGQPLPTLAPIVEKVIPGVVNITTSGKAPVNAGRIDPFQFFFGMPQRPMRERPVQSLGSGVIVDSKNGYVITNAHVVEYADQINVKLRDGREVSAKLIGSDKEVDIAVIQIPAENLEELPIANADNLNVGDFVIAIGNPFGLSQTVTTGIVSALNRSGLGIGRYEDYIQTDASINPGNSGGALVNLKGELVGINTLIRSPNGGNVGIGFAIPAELAQSLMRQIVSFGEVRRGLLGVYGQDINHDLAQALGLPVTKGALINEVIEDSAADKAGVEAGDIVTEVNGREINSYSELSVVVGTMGPGEKVKIKLLRDGKTKKLKATLQAREDQKMAGNVMDDRFEGAHFATNEDDDRRGVIISEVEGNSRAYYLGLKKGDLIVSMNNRRIKDLKDMKDILADDPSPLAIKIRRKNTVFYLTLK